MMPEQQRRILGYFIEEAKDHLNTIEQGLLNLQATISDPEMVNEVFRAAHSVKGGAAMLGMGSIQHTAHRLEDYFKILKESPLRIDRTLESMLLQVFDGLQALLEELQGPFGLTDEKAQGVMAGLEPVFARLEDHLNTLVANAASAIPATAVATKAPSAAPKEQKVAPSGEESALKLVFKSDVPSHLREMLALFKRSDTDANRTALQGYCDELTRIGEQFDLYSWSELSIAAYQAIGNPENTYRVLAPVIIKELKKAQELVLTGQTDAIEIVPKLEAMIPPEPEPSPSDHEPAIADEGLADNLVTASESSFADQSLDVASTPAEEPVFDWLEATPDVETTGPEQLPADDFFDSLANGSEALEDSTPASDAESDPAVGSAALNDLADLFEDEMANAESPWEEISDLDTAPEPAIAPVSGDDEIDLFADTNPPPETKATGNDTEAFEALSSASSFEPLADPFDETFPDLPGDSGVSELPVEDEFSDLFGSSGETFSAATAELSAEPSSSLETTDEEMTAVPADFDDLFEDAAADDAGFDQENLDLDAGVSSDSTSSETAETEAFPDFLTELDSIPATEDDDFLTAFEAQSEPSGSTSSETAETEAFPDFLTELDSMSAAAEVDPLAEFDTISEPSVGEIDLLSFPEGDASALSTAEASDDEGQPDILPSDAIPLDATPLSSDGPGETAAAAPPESENLFDGIEDPWGAEQIENFAEADAAALDALDELWSESWEQNPDPQDVTAVEQDDLSIFPDLDLETSDAQKPPEDEGRAELSTSAEGATFPPLPDPFDEESDRSLEAVDPSASGNPPSELGTMEPDPLDLDELLTDDLDFDAPSSTEGDTSALDDDALLGLSLDNTATLEDVDFADGDDPFEDGPLEDGNLDLDDFEPNLVADVDSDSSESLGLEDMAWGDGLESGEPPVSDPFDSAPDPFSDSQSPVAVDTEETAFEPGTRSGQEGDDLDWDMGESQSASIETEDFNQLFSLESIDESSESGSNSEEELADLEFALAATEDITERIDLAFDDPAITDDPEATAEAVSDQMLFEADNTVAESEPGLLEDKALLDSSSDFEAGNLELEDVFEDEAVALSLEPDSKAAAETEIEDFFGEPHQVVDQPDPSLADADGSNLFGFGELDTQSTQSLIEEPDLFESETTTDEASILTPLETAALFSDTTIEEGDAVENDLFETSELPDTAATIDVSDLFDEALPEKLGQPSSDGALVDGGDDDFSENTFDDLEGLLNDDAPDQTVTASTNNFDELDDLLDDDPTASDSDTDFDELDMLLSEEPDDVTMGASDAIAEDVDDLEGLLSEKQTRSSAPAVDISDEFSDLEKLLEEADQTLGGSSPVRSTTGSLVPRRVGGMVDQTMRVSVTHLDTLNNLVGELVVNRNSLEQDQERLRQFLDNLLFQVQQLNDVGQRMRDLYERSLLESSLMSNRQTFQGSGFRSNDSYGSKSDNDHATGATFDALELDRFTGFHTLSQEMIELIVRVRESSSDIGYTIESADQITRQFRQVTTQLQEGLNKARMVPFAQTADRLPRAVRDISLQCGKEARLVVEGRDTLIDKMILERLYDPMTHLVNNAITHGVESPEERTTLGKPREGTITVRAFYQGNQTVIYIADDGAGINPEIVKRKAIKKGLITQSEANAMSVLETYELLFRPGFSTRDQADDFAGRGVGMDVVRTALSEIRGAITIDSEMGKGTSFTIRLPLTLSISKALSCLNNQARIAFPMDGVEDMFDVPRERIQTDDSNQSCIPWRDMDLTFQPLSDLLQFNRSLGRGRVYGGSNDEDMVSIVVLRSANNFIGIQVDRVLGEQEIVIKQLEGPIPKPMGIAGATVLGDGRVMPIADVLELIDIAQGRVRREASSSLWTQTEDASEPEVTDTKVEPTVLIVDDSITVRELLSMSFGKVGYRVEQARDGQEAWEKLRSGLPCDLVFCDIEMPRMDGLELLSRMQKDGTLKSIPIAMLTSRGADRHRQMALDLGASGYFTKPYLEEALLDAAQRMLDGEVLLTKEQDE